jgi:hypothetical protein
MRFTSGITRLPNYILSLDYLSLQQLWYYFLNCVYPNPLCQLSLWEETGAPGENPRLSAERWLTLFTWVRSENRTHVLRGERSLLWRLRLHRVIMNVQQSENNQLPRLFMRQSTRCRFYNICRPSEGDVKCYCNQRSLKPLTNGTLHTLI